MNSGKHYVLWGSAGHARVLAELISLQGGHVDALFDNNPEAESSLESVPCYIGADGFAQWLDKHRDPGTVYGLAAIGGSRGKDRLEIHELYKKHGLQIASIIHPHATVSDTAILGAGTQVLAQSVVSADTRTGEGCIINHGAIADHECVLGDGVHLAPGAVLCGCVQVGDFAMIGAGATVLPRIRIGENTVVGAGSVVTKDLPPDVVVTGNPARIIKTP
jgi:sugar O-acyltransferase (sialic acid O-acetyltransferase NeuD family)